MLARDMSHEGNWGKEAAAAAAAPATQIASGINVARRIMKQYKGEDWTMQLNLRSMNHEIYCTPGEDASKQSSYIQVPLTPKHQRIKSIGRADAIVELREL